MVISDNGASAEGGPTGTMNENQFFNNVPGAARGQTWQVIDELGGPKHFNHYPWGWTFAGNTPFRRWKRETYRGGISRSVHRPLAEAASRPGARCARQYAHTIDMVPTVLDVLGIEAAGDDHGRHPVTDPGRELRPHLRRRRRPRAAPHPVLRDVGTARSTTTAGARCARGPARRSPRPARASAQPIVGGQLAELDAPAGSSTTSTRTSPRTTTSPPTTATS